ERSKNSSTRMIASSIKRLYARCIPLCDSTFFTLSAPTVNLTLTRRLWMGFALMALLTLTSTLVGWYNLGDIWCNGRTVNH
ncbi:hypothetical protein, partial [Vibrio cholerae]|uniref:hypothetical protein n=1 Tax=Vibrio cholerae TaxID=666 RepID=UPI001C11F1B7